MQVLELSLAGQATLPSVVPSLSRPGLCQEVFNILPGTVNPRRGAAAIRESRSGLLVSQAGAGLRIMTAVLSLDLM